MKTKLQVVLSRRFLDLLDYNIIDCHLVAQAPPVCPACRAGSRLCAEMSVNSVHVGNQKGSHTVVGANIPASFNLKEVKAQTSFRISLHLLLAGLQTEFKGLILLLGYVLLLLLFFVSLDQPVNVILKSCQQSAMLSQLTSHRNKSFHPGSAPLLLPYSAFLCHISHIYFNLQPEVGREQ